MNSDPQAGTKTASRSVRLYRRASGDGLPFIPFGLAPLTGLILLALIAATILARHSVEPPLRRSAEQVEADTADRAALSGGRSAPEFLYRLTGARLTLDGRMPDIATRDAVIAAANDTRPAHIEAVVSNLETIGHAPPEGFRDTALRGIEVLKLCDGGTASFNGGYFDVRCELPGSKAEQVRRLASRSLTYGAVGDIEILALEVVETCEDELTRLLEASRIEFAPGSDQISGSKAALLDLTARAAADCPGTLRVEGHTDSTGSSAFNESLSRRRAEAVRAALIQRGVAPSRLIAAGYGSARPIGDNAAEEGRALNRRIEIRIVRPGE